MPQQYMPRPQAECPIRTHTERRSEQGHISMAPLVAQHECTVWPDVHASSFHPRTRLQQQSEQGPTFRCYLSLIAGGHPLQQLTHQGSQAKHRLNGRSGEALRWWLSSLAEQRSAWGACLENPCVEQGWLKEAQREYGGACIVTAGVCLLE